MFMLFVKIRGKKLGWPACGPGCTTWAVVGVIKAWESLATDQGKMNNFDSSELET
jgi:hypothetical protein